jgi:murein DD-endopeptidase MepM/ murein hydrolase activator NlpD
VSAVSFPLRPSTDYKPRSPNDTYTRTGYERTALNPRGEHRGVDLPAPINTIIQLPEKAKLTQKFYGKSVGYFMEWRILAGPWKGRYMRFFHMNRACGFAVGTSKNRKYAVGRVGTTGNSTGPHLHFELGAKPWNQSRDPRWNPTQAFRDAVSGKDW